MVYVINLLSYYLQNKMANTNNETNIRPVLEIVVYQVELTPFHKTRYFLRFLDVLAMD